MCFYGKFLRVADATMTSSHRKRRVVQSNQIGVREISSVIKLSTRTKSIDNSLSPAILLASEKGCLKYPIQKHPTELHEVPWTT